MGKLKIVASGPTAAAQAQARGRLFEHLMSDVLRFYGFSIDAKPNVNYAGMEIDIEGTSLATGIPLYAECKCYETAVDAPKLQAFYGKYTARWRKDKRCQALFIALPCVNSHAKAFYKDYLENDIESTIRLYEEPHVLKALFDVNAIVSPETIRSQIDRGSGTPGDWVIVYTNHGLFWVQYVVPIGHGIANRVAIFTAEGKPVTDKQTLDLLIQQWPELADFEVFDSYPETIVVNKSTSAFLSNSEPDLEEIVEVTGSSACFEYQFPASPEHFVGRQAVLEEIDAFTEQVLSKQTSCRGILFEANSGWGKSSVVLASVARLTEMGHFAVAIDSRSASSSQFILRAIDYSLRKFGDFGGCLLHQEQGQVITGFDGAIKALLKVGKALEVNNRLLFVFLDQFENAFYLPEALRRIRDVFLKVCDEHSNVVFGFSWKTDLIGLTTEFPYLSRDALANGSKRIALATFSESETSALLRRLGQEIRAPLRKDLEFFLSDFSQGYPWLLKKLCAHVKAQREAGVLQSDIASSLLNVEQLFQEDLRGLSSTEEDALRRIARSAPVSISEVSEEFRPEVVQSLVDHRLVVRIGTKYDVYWDIFRDYLNSGHVPVQENYILRFQMRTIVTATSVLASAGGHLNVTAFQDTLGLKETTLTNALRDLRMLGLAKLDETELRLMVNLPASQADFEPTLRAHLRERLRRNRLVWRLLEELESGLTLTIEDIAERLSNWTPYVSAAERTWRQYARILADWMDAADLAIVDSNKRTLKPMNEAHERRLLSSRRRSRRSGNATPSIQYMPIERVAIRLVEAAVRGNGVDWSDIKESTVSKAVSALEDLEFITTDRNNQLIGISSNLRDFVQHPERRPSLFAERALMIKSFSLFVGILRRYKDTVLTLEVLGQELASEMGMEWKLATAERNAKILLDWARHSGLAEGVYAGQRWGPSKGWKEAKRGLAARKAGLAAVPLFAEPPE